MPSSNQHQQPEVAAAGLAARRTRARSRAWLEGVSTFDGRPALAALRSSRSSHRCSEHSSNG